jgi:hypothetical protein
VPKRADSSRRGDDADRLYALPLGEFTSARNALASELKSSGEPERAELVKALAKPTRPAAAINRAVRSERRALKRLLEAGEKLGEAQERLLQRGDRAPLGRAVERERAAVEGLMAAVEAELEKESGASEAMLERARSTLHAAATDPELREELEAGRVTTDHAAVGLGPMSAGAGGPRAKPKRGAGTTEARRKLKRAERELEDAERALGRAEEERSEASGRLEAAEAAVGQLEKRVAAAATARDRARSAVKKK